MATRTTCGNRRAVPFHLPEAQNKAARSLDLAARFTSRRLFARRVGTAPIGDAHRKAAIVDVLMSRGARPSTTAGARITDQLVSQAIRPRVDRTTAVHERGEIFPVIGAHEV